MHKSWNTRGWGSPYFFLLGNGRKNVHGPFLYVRYIQKTKQPQKEKWEFGPFCYQIEESRNTAKDGVLIFFEDISEITGTWEQRAQNRIERERETSCHVMARTLFWMLVARLSCYHDDFVMQADAKKILRLIQYWSLVKLQRITTKPRNWALDY